MAFTEEEILDLSGKECTSIEIPNTIKILKMVKCSLTTLPKLPDELVELYCNENDIRELPKLPKSLKKLVCAHNPNLSHTYDALPEGLEFLDFSCNNFKDIGGENTSIPDSVTELGVGENHISQIYKLPPSLQVFDCCRNKLISLPELPSSLRFLDCSENKIHSLPELPSSLEEINCHKTYIREYGNSTTLIVCGRYINPDVKKHMQHMYRSGETRCITAELIIKKREELEELERLFKLGW